MRRVDDSEVALPNFCVRCAMSEIEATTLVLHAMEALYVVPWIPLGTLWIEAVVINSYWDAGSIIDDYFVFVLLPRRFLFALWLEFELAIRLGRTALLLLQSRGSFWAEFLRRPGLVFIHSICGWGLRFDEPGVWHDLSNFRHAWFFGHLSQGVFGLLFYLLVRSWGRSFLPQMLRHGRHSRLLFSLLVDYLYRLWLRVREPRHRRVLIDRQDSLSLQISLFLKRITCGQLRSTA